MKLSTRIALTQTLLCLANTILISSSTTVFEGPVSFFCSDATCRIPNNCDESLAGNPLREVVKETDDPEIYSDISGAFQIEAPCVMECEGCGGVPGSQEKTDENDSCIGIAGFVYCPETNECLRPWESSCPLTGATLLLEGPGILQCEDGARCTDVSEDCEIGLGSFSISGKYIPGLLGDYALDEKCSMTCVGCDCADCSSREESSTTTITSGSSVSLQGFSSVLFGLILIALML